MASAIYERTTGKIVAIHLGIANDATADKYGRDPKTHGVLMGLKNEDLTGTVAVLVKDGKLVKPCLLKVTVAGKNWGELNPYTVKADGVATVTVQIQKTAHGGGAMAGDEMLDIFPDHPRVIPVTPDDKVKLSGGKASFVVGPFNQNGELAILVFDEKKIMVPENIHVKFKK
jgi:hypothetical protein